MAVAPRHLLDSDLDPAARVLAAAFDEDPTMGWLFPDPASRVEDLTVLFSLVLRAGLRRGHTYGLGRGDDVAGAAIWSPPDIPAFDDGEADPIGPLLHERYGDDGLARLGAFAEAMGAHHPEESHFYLFIVGLDPSRRGQGLGTELLAPVLARCDADGLPAYLESTNPRNLTLYRRLGFETRSEFHPEGGPLITGMWRDPR